MQMGFFLFLSANNIQYNTMNYVQGSKYCLNTPECEHLHNTPNSMHSRV